MEKGLLVIDPASPPDGDYSLRHQLKRLPGVTVLSFGQQSSDCYSCVGYCLLAALRFAASGQLPAITHVLVKVCLLCVCCVLCVVCCVLCVWCVCVCVCV